MITTLMAMTLIVALSAVAVAAVSGDINTSRNDLDHRRAYEAAKAGINDYAFQLHKDSLYWSRCTEVQEPNAVNQVGSTAKRRFVPGNTGGTYSIELLPSTTQAKYAQCSTTNPSVSMLESSGLLKGTFRIRSNGYSGNSEVSIVATFKPATFLDYVYFTQRETSDPVTYGYANGSTALEGAYSQCSKSIEEGRYSQRIPNSNPKQYCDTISFTEGDSINGPMHTNDAFVICGKPVLGRDAFDSIEVSGPPKGWFSTKEISSSGSSCTGYSNNFKGSYSASAPVITPPPTNSELATLAGLKLTGQVRICLSGSTMKVGAGKTCNELVQYNGPIPVGGVVYVSNGACSTTYSPFTTTYPATSGCGNAYIHGEYSGQLTLATENDIIIDGNLIHNDEGVLGLVANNFVRIYHPFSSDSTSTQTAHNACNGGKNGSTSVSNIRVDAAILAINHSFIVDHYDCGAALGDLTVNGAIAQKYRGAVGVIGGSGYLKDYNYDDRLRYIEPPNFIEPQQTDWVIGRQTIE